MQRDGMRIELIGFTEPAPEPSVRPRRANDIGHSHPSFYVLDLDEALAELRAQGVEVVDESRATTTRRSSPADARSPTCEPRTGTGRSPSTCAAPSCVRNTPYRTSFGGAAG